MILVPSVDQRIDDLEARIRILTKNVGIITKTIDKMLDAMLNRIKSESEDYKDLVDRIEQLERRR